MNREGIFRGVTTHIFSLIGLHRNDNAICEVCMKEYLQSLAKADMRDYAPVPFWSWNNCLEKEQLLRQIEQIKEAGCGGFIMHARTGLRTEYLSDEWFSLVEACLDKAAELKMNAWIYDENGWPSGFVGGKLLEKEEFRAPYLEMEEKGAFDDAAYAVFDASGKRLSRGEKAEGGKYRCVYVRRSPANTDILNPDVVAKFIRLTHEEYYRRFKDRFGKELVGFFTDEPQYYRWGTPFSYSAAKLWKERYGEDIADGIIALFEDDEKAYPFRVRYYKMLNELYTNVFYKTLYDWCTAHNCKLTGHSVEETKLYLQMWGGAACTPSYEFEHIPGVDNLGHYNAGTLAARQIGGAAGQLGKKQILTETFGCSGYGSTPDQLRAIAEKQYVHGVNLMCHHLFAYSLAGQGKTDHPPCFSPHMTWWKHFADFNLYFTRLGRMLAESDACVNCAVINPMQSVYLRYYRFDEERAMQTDKNFEALQAELNRAGVLYDITDETILARHGAAEGKVLRVGKRKYDFVVVPDCASLSAETQKMLKEYAAAGGKIYAAGVPRYADGVPGDWSFLRSNVTLGDIAAAGAVRLETDGVADYTYRKGDGFEFLYIVNPSHEEEAHLRLPAGFSRADLFELELYEQPRDIVLRPGEGMLLMPEKGKKPIVYGQAHDVTSEFSFRSATDNNLTLDTVQIDEGRGFGGDEPLVEAFDRLLRARYNGPLAVKYRFEVKGFGKKLILRREKGKYTSSLLNGIPLTFHDSDFDHLFEEADISEAVKEGVNEYVNTLEFYERPHVFWALFDPLATESVRNCLWYDTELENIYILGDFRVDEKRRILSPSVPQSAASLEKNGFPYFAGSAVFAGKVFGESEYAEFIIDGDYSVAEVRVNGKNAGSAMFGNTVGVRLEKGRENEVEIIAVGSLRNMFGPFHFKGDEGGISPWNFTFRGNWKDGKCDDFAPGYRLIPFGIRSVKAAFAENR